MKPAVLLIDDNTEMLKAISDELVQLYAVITTTNGQEALEVLRHEAIQLIISDVMMPVLDGYEVCKFVKSSLEYSHIPVILLTAKNTLRSKITGLELGADAYIEKPFDVEYLLVQMANLLTNRNKLREYFLQSPLSQIRSIAHTKSEELFLEKLNNAILLHIDSQSLDIDKLVALTNMSRTSLFRKIKAISGLTPNELINITRLKKAAELMAEDDFKVYEIAYMVGFNSQTSFGRSFFRQFGITPKEFQKRKQSEKNN
ncbi:response regulator [Mucilaginibacter sp. KACC 22773]|uniref:response regulator transcription factor n=1 Tax=Mucilaginibacter sp. KACC 22773 TaxID=3025671 RepID=UPI0023663B08|nr:response regulator [Mucilaginibacter sp. KACC 22773]WDF77161.1 response regulator [Mucilaginibacter sp. KACC 22773]